MEIGDWAWLRISACTEPESRLHTSLGVGNVCFALHVAAKLDRREAPQTVACSWRDHACVLPVAAQHTCIVFQVSLAAAGCKRTTSRAVGTTPRRRVAR